MLFRRSAADRPALVPSPVEPTAASLTAASAVATADEAFDLAPLLDAFGQVLSAYAQGSFDLPDVSSSEAGEELERWRRHTVLGVPLSAGESRGSLSAAERDYRGAARALTDHRRREKRYVESALSDLRDALWACVERVHTVAQADLHADEATSVQITRVQTAIHGLETHAVKDEVLQAISAITDISRTRRDTQQVAYGMLAERIDQLGSQLEEAKRESETDPLTGLGNRKRFERAAQRAVQMHTLNRAPVSLVLVDLDHLKQINDGYGHSAGDATLQTTADTLTRVFLGDSDVICRIGGDEFVVILTNTNANVAGRLAERLVQKIAETGPPFAADAPALSASVGYASYHGGEGVEAWMGRADAALYRAKREGKGRAGGAD
ncbi:GGDEF domain-containing protein [Gemmatimonas sp.]|uniref:GGDEF domain-containing protein n=1 Tax=Gemmatimonas sp. TaxID=1962908 RepID=UPI00286A6D6F|nr:GGDEF domain-containing protein [Gemmatimonas sp.]